MARGMLWAMAIGLVVSGTAAAAPGPDLSTPRRALRQFIDANRAGEPGEAALAMDLSPVPASERSKEGPVLARELKFVLDRQLWVDWAKVSDEPAGNPADGPDRDLVGEIALPTDSVPVSLTRDAAGSWRISAETVRAIPELYDAHGAGWVGRYLPEALVGPRLFEIEGWQWLGLALLLAVAFGLGALLARLSVRIGRRIVKRTQAKWDDAVLDAVNRPARYLLAGALFAALDGLLKLSVPAQQTVDALVKTELLVATTWLAMRLVSTVADVLEAKLAPAGDGGQARGVKTQVEILRRVASVGVVLCGAALVLMQFSVVRNLGTSLLASAGIAGIVVGLAAQKSISTLLAGIQLSITQPMRIGDTVIVEGEYGTVEEVTLTYVVVSVWDQRRLIVPITRFLDQPFQNWTKVSPEIMGTVMLYADYSVPVEKVRAELDRLVKGDPNWDGRVCGLQLTDASERTVTLRALVSSADAGKNWDLRCAVREKLIAFLRELEGGRYLPRTRVQPHEGSVQIAKSAA